MDKMPLKYIFTPNDRICSQCYSRRAASKDWFCDGCRQTREALWKDIHKQQGVLMPHHSLSQRPTELYQRAA